MAKTIQGDPIKLLTLISDCHSWIKKYATSTDVTYVLVLRRIKLNIIQSSIFELVLVYASFF